MPGNNITPENKHMRSRPKTITLISFMFFLFSLFNMLKLSQAIFQWKTLISFQISISPLYLVVTGLVWSVFGLFVSWSLWTRKSWGRKSTLVIVMFYTIIFWVDLIWIAEPTVLQTRWLVNLCLTIIGLPTVYLSLYSKLSQDYFRGNTVKID